MIKCALFISLSTVTVEKNSKYCSDAMDFALAVEQICFPLNSVTVKKILVVIPRSKVIGEFSRVFESFCCSSHFGWKKIGFNMISPESIVKRVLSVFI